MSYSAESCLPGAWPALGGGCVCVCAVSSRVSCVFYLCVSLLGFGGSWLSKGFTVKPRLFFVKLDFFLKSCLLNSISF